MIALVYNWWSLFVRLVEAEKHYEGIHFKSPGKTWYVKNKIL